MIPLIKTYDRYQAEQRINDTNLTIAMINSEIADFYAQNNRYPCPSDRSLGFNTVGHGNEECTALAALGNGNCGGAVIGGYCRAGNPTTNEPIYIGGVPYVALGLPGFQALDGWKNTLTYVVTASLTDAATFDPDEGQVVVVDEFGNPVYDTVDDGVHGALFSSGSNGAGAYNMNGNSTPCIVGIREEENCDNDGLFVRSLLYEAPGADYYDDYLDIANWDQNNIWVYLNNEDIRNTNPGNIGIGTDSPGEALDVVGNIRAQEMHGTQFCDNDPTSPNCMLPEVVGGAGRNCANSNDAVVGISNNNVNCEPMSFEIQDVTCDPGEFVVRIVGGIPECDVVVSP